MRNEILRVMRSREGYVSGQELWQFFACFGPAGFLGFLLSAALFLLVDLALLQLSRKSSEILIFHWSYSRVPESPKTLTTASCR